MNYEETGNKVPISLEELINYVQQQLYIYDNIKAQNPNIVPSINPYTQPIIYETQDGKIIKIPANIQKQAIELYNKKKENNDINYAYDNGNLPSEEYDYDVQSETYKPTFFSENNMNKYLKLAILILAALLALYYLKKMFDNDIFYKSDAFVPGATNTRYYLKR